MRVYFVRHAQSGNNAVQLDDAIGFDHRVPDPPLTDKGHQQATTMSQWLFTHLHTLHHFNKTHDHTPISGILCSPMMRALQTANYLGTTFSKIPVIVVSDLCEIGGLFYGPRNTPSVSPRGDHLIELSKKKFYGLNKSEIKNQFSSVREMHGIFENGWWFLNRETNVQAIERAWRVARALWNFAASCEKTSIIIITHGLFQHLLLKILLKCSSTPETSWPTFATTPSMTLDLGDFGLTVQHTTQQETTLNKHLNLTKDTCIQHLSPNTRQLVEEDDHYSSASNDFFLCNNVGISLLELFVTKNTPYLSQRQQTDTDDQQCQLTSTYHLGILYWNCHSFLSSEELTESGQTSGLFSLY